MTAQRRDIIDYANDAIAEKSPVKITLAREANMNPDGEVAQKIKEAAKNAEMENSHVEPEESEIGSESAEQLQRFIERIERIEEEKAGLSADVKDIYTDAKGSGFDPKVMRQIIRMRKMDQRDIDEEEALLHLYKQALGMR